MDFKTYYSCVYSIYAEQREFVPSFVWALVLEINVFLP